MFKVIFLSFILNFNAFATPKASTIYNEFIKVFAFYNQEYLKKELFSNGSIFQGGCDFESELAPTKLPCKSESIASRAQKFPSPNKIFNIKLYSICRKLVADEREIKYFVEKFNIEDMSRGEMDRVHDYFHPFLSDNENSLNKVWDNIKDLNTEKRISSIFMTYCMDPRWL